MGYGDEILAANEWRGCDGDHCLPLRSILAEWIRDASLGKSAMTERAAMANRSRKRVLTALNFHRPDILPLFENYWPEFIEQWRTAKGLAEADVHTVNDYYGNDMITDAADESPWPSLTTTLEGSGDSGAYYASVRQQVQKTGDSICRNGWGIVSRVAGGSYFSEELTVALEEKEDPDKLTFESPCLERRYQRSDAVVREYGDRYAIFAKTGGPFKRPSFLRGYVQFLYDIAEDPEWVRALVARVMSHLTSVGVEQLRRNGSSLAGIQINDDVCSLRGPLIAPQTYARICLPSLRRMVQAYKDAGAAKVYMHCDGNVMPLVEMWVDAGIEAINPCERRAGVDVFALRKRYGDKLAFIGAMDNCEILPRGSKADITTHVRELAELGRDGGLVMGGHSIGPDVSVEHYEWAMAARREYGSYDRISDGSA